MRAIIVAMLLFSLPVFAGENPSYRPLGQPQPGDLIEGPIPSNECLEILWANKSPDGYRITMHHPPIPRDIVQAMERLRAKGEIAIRYCELSDT